MHGRSGTAIAATFAFVVAEEVVASPDSGALPECFVLFRDRRRFVADSVVESCADGVTTAESFCCKDSVPPSKKSVRAHSRLLSFDVPRWRLLLRWAGAEGSRTSGVDGLCRCADGTSDTDSDVDPLADAFGRAPCRRRRRVECFKEEVPARRHVSRRNILFEASHAWTVNPRRSKSRLNATNAEPLGESTDVLSRSFSVPGGPVTSIALAEAIPEPSVLRSWLTVSGSKRDRTSAM